MNFGKEIKERIQRNKKNHKCEIKISSPDLITFFFWWILKLR